MQINNFSEHIVKNKDEFYQDFDNFSSTNGKSKKIGIVKMNELDNTFTKKFTKIKNPKRANPRKYNDSDIHLTKMNNNIIVIDETLFLANEFYDKKFYAKAAKLYESVINTKEIEFYLAKESYNDILKDLYLCHFNLWKKSRDDQKEIWLQTTFESLFHLLTKLKNQTTANLFNIFANDLYRDALKEIGKNNDSAFNKLHLLIEIDLKFKDMINNNIDINHLFDEILFNMTVCIENKGPLNTKMIEIMFIFLIGNKLIDRDLKNKYLNWLEDNFSNSEGESFDENLREQEMEVDNSNVIFNVLKWTKSEDNLYDQFKKTEKLLISKRLNF